MVFSYMAKHNTNRIKYWLLGVIMNNLSAVPRDTLNDRNIYFSRVCVVFHSFLKSAVFLLYVFFFLLYVYLLYVFISREYRFRDTLKRISLTSLYPKCFQASCASL